jgi:hypothetical protein
MIRSRLASFVLGAALFTIAPAVVRGLDQRSIPTANANPAHRPQGFFDYALGKVNPENKDYGTQMQQARNALVHHSLDDLYFWSNAFTLTLLIAVTACLFIHLRAGDKKEVICAALIAQLWNGRVSDRIEIERRTEQYNRLVESHNADVEGVLMSQSQPAPAENQASSKLQRTVAELTEKLSAGPRSDRNLPLKSPGPVANDTQSPGQPALGIEQQNLLLQRRIEAMKNTEENLKERLNRTTLLLEQERNRNQTLKGA